MRLPRRDAMQKRLDEANQAAKELAEEEVAATEETYDQEAPPTSGRKSPAKST